MLKHQTSQNYTNTEVKAFLEDILCKNNITDARDTSRSICNFVGNLSGDHIKAWKICKDARPNSPGLRLDWDILRSVVDYENNHQLKADLTIESTDRFLKILKEYSGECNTCKPNPTTCARLPRMHLYLNRLKDFTVKYSNKTGFGDFITGEATASSLNKQDGANHLMRRLNESSYPAGDALSFEGNIHSKIPAPRPRAICDCKYDVEEPGGVLVDYKSFNCDSPLGNPNQFKQYLQYWSATPPVRNFKYVFNSDKVNLEQAKKKFVDLLKTDPEGFYDVNPAFFNRIDKTDGSGDKVSNATEFIIELNKSNFWQNPIFDFVSIVP